MKIKQLKEWKRKSKLYDWWYYSWPRYKGRNLYYYIRNRFFRKYYLLDIKAMERHEWYDSDYQLFHAVFQILVNYVEEELGHGSEEKAMEHLEWEVHLDDGVDMKGYTGPTQASVAKQVRELYVWYKYDRAKRPDPWNTLPEPDGLHIPYTHELQSDGMYLQIDHKTPEQQDAALKYYREIDRIEQEQNDEDTKKAQEVLAIREFLWS